MTAESWWHRVFYEATRRTASEEKYPRDDFELMLGFAKDEWQYSRGQSHTSQHGSAEQVKAVFAQVFGNEGDVLQHFPGFDGLDRGQLRDIATRFGRLYGDFIRSGDPGPDWPRFESGTSTVLWLGEQVQPRPHLLDGEWDASHAGGITDVSALQMILVANTRRALNNRKRAFAVDSGAPDAPSRSA